jgi:hypothetical protein
MKASTILPLLTALLAAPTFAKQINFGKARYDDGHVDNAIWIDGQNACNYVYLGPQNVSPCLYNNGGEFWLPDGYGYYLASCEAIITLDNADRSVFGQGFQNGYSYAGHDCGNSHGQFHVDQEWSFRHN